MEGLAFYPQTVLEGIEEVAVGAWFSRTGAGGEYEIGPGAPVGKRNEEGVKAVRNWDFPQGTGSLGTAFYKHRVWTVISGKIYPGDGAPDMYYPGFKVDIGPVQGAEFPYAHAGCKSHVDSKVPGGGIIAYGLVYKELLPHAEEFQGAVGMARGVSDAPGRVIAQALFCSVAQNHPHYQYHKLHAGEPVAIVQLLQDKILEGGLCDTGTVPEGREQMLVKEGPVRCVRALLHILLFICLPDKG